MLGDDLTPFFGDFAATVIAGAVTGKGILDMPTIPIGDGMVLSTEYLLTAPTADFGGLKAYADIEVDGIAYTVREVRQLVEISLSKVTA